MKSFGKTALAYSVCWALCAVAIAGFFVAYGKTLLWLPDGLQQHFSAYNYVCGAVTCMLSGQAVAAYDFTLGQGADVLATLGSYDYCDPISWATALLPLEPIVKYHIMVALKLYLVGFSFICYCWAAGHKTPTPAICGAIAYCFSGAILFVFARHPNFINWAYFLPFLMGGGRALSFRWQAPCPHRGLRAECHNELLHPLYRYAHPRPLCGGAAGGAGRA